MARTQQLEVLNALDKAKTQWYHFTAIIISGMGFFTDAYDLFCITTVTKLLGRLYYYDPATGKPGSLPPNVSAAVNGVALCGTLAGQLFFGWLGDKLGRKKVYGMTLITMVGGALASGLSFGHTAKSVMTTLCFFRFWLGFGIGGDYPLSATIMSEYANKKTRGAFIAAVFAMQGFGILTGGAVSIIVAASFNKAYPRPTFEENPGLSTAPQADFVWRIILMFGAIPALLAYYWRLKMPETARYTALVAKNTKLAASDMAKVLQVDIEEQAPETAKAAGNEQFGLFSREFARRHGLHLLGTTTTWFLLDIAFYEDESSDESSDEGDAKPKVKQQTAKLAKGKNTAKVVKQESSSEEESSEESDDEPKYKHQVAKGSKREEDSDEEMEDMEGQTPAAKDTLATPKYQKDQAFTPNKSKTPVTPGSRTLYVGNLSYSIDNDNLFEFFQDAGEVVDVRLSKWEDGSLKGFAHVRFATEEAARKAMDKNGQDLLGRPVRLDHAADHGTPALKQNWSDNGNQQGRKSGCTAFVRGFDKYQEENDIRNSLTEHFGKCGKIENIRIPKDYESGAFKGFAYIDFQDNATLSKALELSSDELYAVEATVPRSGGRDGSGRSGGRDGSGRRGGRGFGDGGGRFSGGRGRDGGRGTPRGRGRGMPRIDITSSATGKKTTFGDD